MSFRWLRPTSSLTKNEEKLISFFPQWGVTDMIAMPNFESNVDMLGGPTGYACTINNTAPFTRDLFLDVPLGMGLSMYKVKSTKGWSYHIPESAEQACVDRLRSELRDKAEYPPKLRSAIPSETAMDISGAWEPSLGVDGFVALLAKLDAKGSTHYVLVRAGLDPATIGEAETLFSEAEMDGKTMKEMVPLFHDIQIAFEALKKLYFKAFEYVEVVESAPGTRRRITHRVTLFAGMTQVEYFAELDRIKNYLT